ncbi:MAG: hypothetical protein LLF28_02695 [Nitrospiraceae bacterium]|nr:hypothetical protein [Nitrospiraceae bacterium]
MRISIYALFISFLLVSCAPPSVKTTMLTPAKFHDASMIKEIAILPFDGQGGAEFAAELEGMFAGINLNDKQYFTIVDRNKIDKIISELKFTQSALVDEKTAVKVGKLVGAKGIYSGVITSSKVSDNYFTESRSRCAYTATQYDKKGKPYQVCAQYENYNVRCSKRTAIFSATPKLIEIETGRVVYANNISGSENSSACEDTGKPLIDKTLLLKNARDRAKSMLRTDVAPYYVTVQIKLLDSTSGITSKEAENKLEQGIDFAKNNRLDRACEIWGEGRILAPNSSSILYNLGICAEVTGSPEQALDLYKKADRLMNQPDENITAALARVNKAIQDKDKLKKQTQ